MDKLISNLNNLYDRLDISKNNIQPKELSKLEQLKLRAVKKRNQNKKKELMFGKAMLKYVNRIIKEKKLDKKKDLGNDYDKFLEEEKEKYVSKLKVRNRIRSANK